MLYCKWPDSQLPQMFCEIQSKIILSVYKCQYYIQQEDSEQDRHGLQCHRAYFQKEWGGI